MPSAGRVGLRPRPTVGAALAAIPQLPADPTARQLCPSCLWPRKPSTPAAREGPHSPGALFSLGLRPWPPGRALPAHVMATLCSASLGGSWPVLFWFLNSLSVSTRNRNRSSVWSIRSVAKCLVRTAALRTVSANLHQKEGPARERPWTCRHPGFHPPVHPKVLRARREDANTRVD